MRTSESITKLAAAMAKAQAQIGAAKKTSRGNFGKYADLASVWDACEDALRANGLSVLQGFSTEGQDGSLWTMLLHESGEYVTGTCPLVLGKRDPQGIGSATTYYRRYGLAAMLGITQEDDDAERAMPARPARLRDGAVADAVRTNAPATGHDYTADLEAAASLADLEARWAKIPAESKGALFGLKKAMRTKLANEGGRHA